MRVRAICAAIGLFLLGCGQVDNESSRKESEETWTVGLDADVWLNVEVTELQDGRVRIGGSTNLPTGTRLMLSVEELAHGGFHGQSKCSVLAGGSIESEPFGPVTGLKDGKYSAEVLMPIPRVQPDHVKQIIGADGENLSGPLVDTGSLGASLSAEKEFTIGGVLAASHQKERGDARSQVYRDWLQRAAILHDRLLTARSSEWLGHGNLADTVKWCAFARNFRKDMQSHQEQLESVQPLYARILVATAIHELHNMFQATAFSRHSDYQEAGSAYARSVEELSEYILEVQTAP